MPEPLIEFRSVSKSFDSQVVLNGVNLTVEHNLVTTIIGRSGVGKSVMLKLIVGLLQPDSGEILYRGNDLFSLSRWERRSFKRDFSYMFQHMALFDSMTVFENIALPLEEKTEMPRAAIRRRVAAKLKQLDLHGIEEKYPSQLSGGMRKRVALARALVIEPKIVFFDEPTTGLDPVHRDDVLDLIARSRKEFGFTAIVVSHDIPDVFRISQRVAMLEEGKIVFEGTPGEIQTCEDPRVRQFIRWKPDRTQTHTDEPGAAETPPSDRATDKHEQSEGRP